MYKLTVTYDYDKTTEFIGCYQDEQSARRHQRAAEDWFEPMGGKVVLEKE